MKIVAVLSLLVLSAETGISATSQEWRRASGWRSQDLSVPSTAATPRLTRLSSAVTGISFTNELSEAKAMESSLLTSGAGVAAGDVDGDGRCDIYFCGLERGNQLWRNLGGWKFENITDAAGVACKGSHSTGASFGDIDGDGDLDLLVNSLGTGTRLLVNDGKGRFSESQESGLLKRFGSTSMALGDIDGNGTLDLYVANYATTKIEDRPNARFTTSTINGVLNLTAIDGVPLTSPELTNRYFIDPDKIVRELGEPDVLYLNDGQGHFRPLGWTDGRFRDEQGNQLALPPYDFGLSVMFRDVNGDRAPDLYICNDLFPPDRIWINDGAGKFQAMSTLAVRNTSRFSMGLDFADLDRDGHDDFFVVDMLSRDHQRRKVQMAGLQSMFLPVGKVDNRPQYRRNTLYRGRGDGTFAEISHFAGLSATEWSWMPLFLDLDLDGFEDVFITTGHHRDSLNEDSVARILEARKGKRLSDAEHRDLKKLHYPTLALSNQAFRNMGNLTFVDQARDWGFDYVGISHGMCLADLDDDGDLDLLVNHLNDGAGVYRNECVAPRLSVRLKGLAPNTRGIGARIKVTGGPVPQSQEMIGGGRYLSSDDTVRMFAAGSMTNRLRIQVLWRSGHLSEVTEALPNTLVEIEEPQGVPPPPKPTPNPPRLFTDISSAIAHVHVDARFDDFERQPLLSRRLSQGGPGLSWVDFDGDGWEDLVIGSGAGGQTALYRNDSKGGFVRAGGSLLTHTNDRDQTSLLGWRRADGSFALLAGSANYEDGVAAGHCVRTLDVLRGKEEDLFPAWEISVGPLALADVDGDGLLDLFVGGRVLAGRYPESTSSLLFRGTGAGFEVDRENSRRLGLVGLVNGAVFADLDGDSFPELVVACDWGSIKVFKNEAGRLRNVSRELGFATLTGFWNGVSCGDFDADGRLDLIGSNWGANSKYQDYRKHGLRIYFGTWTDRPELDTMEAYLDVGLRKWVPWCTFVAAKSLPWVIEQYPTYTSFSSAGVADILGERTQGSRMLQATWLETTVFLNRGDHFEPRTLPIEAQMSPAFGVVVADFNGDGNEDVFLAQNFFAVDGDTPRYDAGRGLCLLGDGRGGFNPLDGVESGIMVYGEQRGAAACDYDQDGRPDLAVGQNGGETRLFRNSQGRPGLRVSLNGPVTNPLGIGVLLRLSTDQWQGPIKQVHAGTGYWSQDSAVQILASPAPTARRLWIKWPQGKEYTITVPDQALKVTVDAQGAARF
ncbi:MAG: VCBS repeat-containing protein [Verrucomicrobiales bacterium]|nr:VCBS repeat-containing protein [Verrucomicrobiales bacterium]